MWREPDTFTPWLIRKSSTSSAGASTPVCGGVGALGALGACGALDPIGGAGGAPPQAVRRARAIQRIRVRCHERLPLAVGLAQLDPPVLRAPFGSVVAREGR